MSTSDAPYLSVVATARNDDHGGNLLGRMQAFVDALAAQCERHGLEAELVLVEWNPPADRESLAEAVRWHACNRLVVRVITVPEAVHRRFAHSDALPLFQMIAKNAGIRRSRGRFVLATNIDVLFSDELFAFLAAKGLRTDRAYRVDRLDVEPMVPDGATLDEMLAWCRGHVARRNERAGSTSVKTGEFHRIYWDLTPRVRLLEALQDWRLVPAVTRKRLHLNACGDFTLMAREKWEELRGYPELEMYSMHLDSVLCTAAHFGGAREAFLPPPIVAYHLEHGKGSGWSPEGERALNERLAKAGIPQLGHDRFHQWAVQMRRDRKAMLFNDADWGLFRDELPEHKVKPAMSSPVFAPTQSAETPIPAMPRGSPALQ